MLITRPGSQVFVPTFPLITSVGAGAGSMALLASGAPLVFGLLCLGLAWVYAALALAGFVWLRRADDRLLIRWAFKHLDVPRRGTSVGRVLRPYSKSQGPRAALVLVLPDGPAIELAHVSGFTPGGALRSAQAIGERMAAFLGIPFAPPRADRDLGGGAR